MTFPIPGVPPLPPLDPDQPDPRLPGATGNWLTDAISGAVERVGDFIRAALADAARAAIVIVGTIALTGLGVVMILAGIFSLLGLGPKDAAKGGAVGVIAQLVGGK